MTEDEMMHCSRFRQSAIRYLLAMVGIVEV